MGGTFQPATTLDELTREAGIIVVGTLAGHDGSFYTSPRESTQYTTYYLKVTGYLKDVKARRAPFLKVLAPGGFLGGGDQAEAPVPYLERNRRYLLYLIPNLGMVWGLFGKPDHSIGSRDEYWAAGRGIGRWWEDEGRLVGPVPASDYYPFPAGTRQPAYLPFGEGLQQVAAAVKRERLGVPFHSPKREAPKFADPTK